MVLGMNALFVSGSITCMAGLFGDLEKVASDLVKSLTMWVLRNPKSSDQAFVADKFTFKYSRNCNSSF